MSKDLNVRVAPSADRKSVRIDISHEGKRIPFSIPAESAGQLAVAILGVAAVCAKKPPFSQGKPQNKLAFVQANGVALSEAETPGVVCLTFAFGATELSIGLSREALRPLGTALLADSADKGRGH
jgi:hypothetical protein